MEEPFITTIIVGKREAMYIYGELSREMVLSVGQVLEPPKRGMSSTMLEIEIRGLSPLSLAQRRLLVACGLTFTSR